MSQKYQPKWLEYHWKQVQLIMLITCLPLSFLLFLIDIYPISMLLLYIGIGILIYGPPGGTSKERLERDRFRLSVYIDIIGDALAVSEFPVETFHDLITHFISIKRFTDEDLSLILSHFAGRADEVGQEVRRLVREEDWLQSDGKER